MDQTFVGHKAIAARLANKNGPTLRHMMTNIRIKPVDATTATGVSYALIYGGAKSTGPSMVANFTAMGEYFDEYQYSKEGCRFSQRKFVATFLPGASGAPAQTTNTAK
jgi:intein-encoded DNA endonuclease-like protein